MKLPTKKPVRDKFVAALVAKMSKQATKEQPFKAAVERLPAELGDSCPVASVLAPLASRLASGPLTVAAAECVPCEDLYKSEKAIYQGELTATSSRSYPGVGGRLDVCRLPYRVQLERVMSEGGEAEPAVGQARWRPKKMELETLIARVKDDIGAAQARLHHCRDVVKAADDPVQLPTPHPHRVLPDAKMREPVRDPDRLTIDYQIPEPPDPPASTHQAKLLEQLRKEENRERLVKMLVPKRKGGAAKPTGHSLFCKEQTAPTRRRLELAATASSLPSKSVVLAAVRAAWKALPDASRQGYKARAKQLILESEQNKSEEATAEEAKQRARAERKLLMFELQLKLGCMSAHCDGQDAYASNQRRTQHRQQCSYTTLLDVAEPDPDRENKLYRDGATLLAGKPVAGDGENIRSAYEFMEALKRCGSPSQTHHIVRLPAGCIKFVQAGATMHMPVAAVRRAVSIDYAHRFGYELAVDAGRADGRIMDATSRADSRSFFNETCMRARY